MVDVLDGEKSERKLELLKRKEEEESVNLLSKKYKISYHNLSTVAVEIDAIKIIPEAKARRGDLVIFQASGKRLKIGVRSPDKEETTAILKGLERDRYIYELFLVSRHSLEHAWEFYKKVPVREDTEAGTVQVSHERIKTLQKELAVLDDIKERVKKTFYAKTTEELEIILAGALSVDASDVHLEPHQGLARLRFRMDGVLHDIIEIPLKVYLLMLSRIKLVSELKLNVHDRAQDGRFTIKTGGEEIEVRTSVLPGPAGENVVLRVLNPKTIGVSFHNLGMQLWTVETMERELKKPNGMILTTGPTGSGKTTTLYSFLQKILSPEIKIITIEDPIEYHITGLEQTQVDAEKGYDFANGLRSIVRQDPDIILVGEIRDFETAETAMHASLTGHLVFSTLHTNDAAGTIPRLLDLGVQPAIIAPAINVAMAQRLIRRLCNECKIPKRIAAAEKEVVKKRLAGFPKGIAAPDEKSWTIFQTSKKPCASCSGIGYKGRIGIFEIILIDEKIEALILKRPAETEIKKEALTQGQTTMHQDGLLKVLAGMTDFAELERVMGT